MSRQELGRSGVDVASGCEEKVVLVVIEVGVPCVHAVGCG
jgi:hypothetical protein